MFVRNGQAVGSVLHKADPTTTPKPVKKKSATKPKPAAPK